MRSTSTIRDGWRPSSNGRFLERDGPAASEPAAFAAHKLCLYAAEQGALLEVLDELLSEPTAYYGKVSNERRGGGVYEGRAFFATPDAAGRAWARLKKDPRVSCAVQDDDFVLPFRPLEALLRSARRARSGKVVVGTGPRGKRNPVEAVHQLALGQLLMSKPRWWKPLDAARARQVLEALWATDLGRRAPQLPPAKAARAADRFIRWMAPDAAYFTVPELAERHADGGGLCDWYSLTGATYDAGVAAVDDHHVAIVWFADED